MKKIFRSRFFDSHSDIRKAAPQTKIQNLKWLGLSVIALSPCGDWGCGSGAAGEKIPRIGYLMLAETPRETTRFEGIRLALRELGYINGQNITIEYRSGRETRSGP